MATLDGLACSEWTIPATDHCLKEAVAKELAKFVDKFRLIGGAPGSLGAAKHRDGFSSFSH